MVSGDQLMTRLAGRIMSTEGLRDRRKEGRDEEEEEGVKEGWGGTETFNSSSLRLRLEF